MISDTLEVPGAALSTVRWEPEGEPRALLQLVHGMAEHIRRYDYVAQAFCKAGFLVFGHDTRGHGQSAKRGELGHMGAWNVVVEDIRRVGDHERKKHGDLPMAVLAHSMGSFMAQQLILDAPQHAAAWILSGSNGKPPAIAAAGRLVARFERWRVKESKPSNLLQNLSFGKFNDGFEGRTEFDWLSRDEAQVDAYVSDPLCGFGISTESWVGLLDALGPIADPFRQRRIPKGLPVFIVGGGEDPVSEKGKGLRRLKRAYDDAGLTNVTLSIHEGARHEILNETNRDEVIEELITWATKNLRLSE